MEVFQLDKDKINVVTVPMGNITREMAKTRMDKLAKDFEEKFPNCKVFWVAT